MPNPQTAKRIRSIFLHEQPYVTITEAARLLGWTRSAMERAVRDGDIEVTATCSGPRVAIRELAEIALQLWTLPVIEGALGRDAALILPPALRTRKLVLRLPAYQLAALTALAAEGNESIDTMLSRMFEELADIRRDLLEPVIPGLAEAIAWPSEPTPPTPH